MKVRNENIYLKWKKLNVSDGYSFDIFKFSEKWASLMEAEIEKGHKIEDIAEKTSEIAGKKELTKTMFDFSLDILHKCWIYGYELEGWSKKNKNNLNERRI